MTSQQPYVSVIVPVRNAERLLPSLIQAVSAQDYPAERRELILVDNGSTDSTGKIIRDSELQGVRGVRQPAGGSYTARNAGVRISSGSVLAFTDADCTPEPTWLSQGVQRMVDAGIDVLAGGVRQAVDGHPNLFQMIDQMIYLRQAWYQTQGFGATANLFARRRVFEALGGFDGRLQSSGDRMLCFRAAQEGYRFGYNDGAIVNHCPRTTARAIALKEVRLGQGFGQIFRLYPKSDGLRLFGQTYLRIPGIRSGPGREALDIPPARAILALATYSLIHILCRTYGFLKAVCAPGAPAENGAAS
ncbi:glycosyltransferase [Candidatus Zixiibacteriota bacterium]